MKACSRAGSKILSYRSLVEILVVNHSTKFQPLRTVDSTLRAHWVVFGLRIDKCVLKKNIERCRVAEVHPCIFWSRDWGVNQAYTEGYAKSAQLFSEGIFLCTLEKISIASVAQNLCFWGSGVVNW